MKVVYTCITGGYDYVKDPLTLLSRNGNYIDAFNPEWRYLLFTDNAEIKSEYWEVLPIPESIGGLPSVLQQRNIKSQLHKYVDYELAVYIDGSQQLTCDPDFFKLLIDQENTLHGHKEKGQADLLFKKHPIRATISEEVEAVLALGKIDNESVDALLSSMTVVDAYPLAETGVFVTKNNESTRKVMDDWWYYIMKCHRDQLSLPVALGRNSAKVAYFNQNLIDTYGAVQLHGHVKNQSDVKVNYITAYANDSNLGAEYNRQADRVGDGEWLCFMDGDAMFLDNKFGAKITQIIEDNEKSDNPYHIIGCMTNRLRSADQLFGGSISNDGNVGNHKRISDHLWNEFGTEIKEADKPIAGLFMLMKKETWELIKFKNGLTRIDTDFGARAMRSGKRIGIAKGLYMFHYYRFGEDINNITHLTHPR